VLTIVVLAVAKVSKNVLPQMAPGFATDYTDEYKERIRPPIVWINAACPALARYEFSYRLHRKIQKNFTGVCTKNLWLCILAMYFVAKCVLK
jgi:hypothetical protein